MGCNFTSFDPIDLCTGSNGRSQRALSTRTFGRQSIGVVSCYYVLYIHSRFLLNDFFKGTRLPQKQPHTINFT